MAVPNTTTFSLQDVVTEVGPTTNDLVDCFADANLQYFDPTYYSTGDDLLEFRNYCSSTSTCATQIFAHYWSTFAQPQNACIQTVSQGRYVRIGETLATATVLWQDSPTKVTASAGWHEAFDAARYWNGSSFTSSATCLNWNNVLPSSGSSVLYTACGQSLGATKRYYTDNLVATEILYSDAGYTTWTTTTNHYYRYTTTGGTNSVGLYFKVNNTTGTVSEVGSCPASTTTTTTTASYFAVSVSSTASSDTTVACGLTLDLTKYVVDSIANGEIIYNDAACTIAWTGAAKFYHRIGAGGRCYVSSVTGQISNFGFCI